ncbi:SusC/RagA family TonB-linked outer membrane protein [Pedobacter lithocola]|uniref:SusC/RagA family TonB-linked outer membrane protein n=1 Tax=Pedobacter lithocola TaxID=1908239 RepID=A0ABV8PBI1_9SPHI
MKKFKFFSIVFLLLLITNYANAQSKTISGVVRDVQGPLPGAIVEEKGTENRTSTNGNGEYKLTLRGNGNTLIIRLIGYVNREISISGNNSAQIVLQQASQDLSEVVVTGYTTQKKITLTGAQSAVSGNDIRQNPSGSLQNTLAGRVTGFISQQRVGQPGSDGAAFLVRGESSLNNNAVNGVASTTNNPLIIVDNIEYSYEQFSRLEANEVESITILKDASQTAVYGIKGGNGVVIVTTRRGKIGKPRISVRTDFALSEPTILPDYLDSYNTALLRNQAEINDNSYAPNPSFRPTWSAADLEAFRTGSDPIGHPNVNWKEMLFKKYAPQLKTNFDISGGTTKARYFVSLSYLNQGGNTKDYYEDSGDNINSGFYNKRFNYRSNLDISVTKNLTLQLDAFGNIGEINRPNIFYPSTNGNKDDIFADFGSYLALSPMAYPIKNPDGSWGYSQFQANSANYLTPNIIERLTYGGFRRNNENNMVLSTTATEKLDFITKGLSVQGRVAYTNNYTVARSLTRTNLPSYIFRPSVFAADGSITSAERYDPAFANVYTIGRLGNAYGTNGSAGSTQRRLAAQALITYSRQFAENHHIDFLGVYSLSSNNVRSDDLTYNFVPASVISRVAKIGYDYKNKYIVNVTGTLSGSNRFTGKKKNGFFPAASAAYNIAEEDFFKKRISFVNLLKFRASWGIVGNDQLAPGRQYAYQQSYATSTTNSYRTSNNGTIYSFGESNGTLSANTGYAEGALANTDVTWDKERQFDIGLDFAFFNNKLTGLVDYFKYRRYDQLIAINLISDIQGVLLPPQNIGESTRQGLEFELNYRSTIGNEFAYNFRGTFSNVKNAVVFNGFADPQYPWQSAVGKPIGAEGLYQYLGFFKDMNDVNNSPTSTFIQRPGDLKYADLNGDNVIDDKDRVVADYSNTPQNTFGFQFGFNYKGVGLSILFQGATKFYLRGTEEAIRPFSANLQAVHQQAWTPALGDNAKFPVLTTLRSISDPGINSTYWAIPGDYLRLRTAELSYDIPTSIVKKLGLQGIRFFASGNNLITWSKAFNLYAIDPEATPGNDRQAYPPSRIYNIGLNVNL